MESGHVYLHTALQSDAMHACGQYTAVSIGAIRFNLGSYVDSHGQRHPLDLEIPSVYYVPESTMNLLPTTHLKLYNIHLNSHCGPNVLIIPGLPSQVSGVWGNWYQGYGRDGYPAIYLNLGEGKPVLRTKTCRRWEGLDQSLSCGRAGPDPLRAA